MKKITTALLIFLLSLSVLHAKAKHCKDFSTQSEAQKYFKAKGAGWKRLDGDKDGEACECLEGGSGYDKSSCNRWRKKYNK
jgi:S-adenosylhomocysteine hydrolase